MPTTFLLHPSKVCHVHQFQQSDKQTEDQVIVRVRAGVYVRVQFFTLILTFTSFTFQIKLKGKMKTLP